MSKSETNGADRNTVSITGICIRHNTYICDVIVFVSHLFTLKRYICLPYSCV